MWFYCLYISSYYFIALNLKIKKAIFDAPFFIMFKMYYLKFKILYIPFWKKKGDLLQNLGFFLGGGGYYCYFIISFFYICDKKMCF